ncbi:MAG: cation transporter [Candidatus Magasanikbacteria bacterium]|nr:cation transporter [Candidatus Magasanikbacteria bacterium]
METKIKITGMHCPSCKMLIEDVASELSGVQSCTVDQSTGVGMIVHDESFDFAEFEKEIAGLEKYKVEKI